jgi:biopolymer transport protein ExbB/TolQ
VNLASISDIFNAIVFQLPASFVQAGVAGKTVMIVLALASVWSWVLIGEGIYELFRLKRAVAGFRGGNTSRVLAPIVGAGKTAGNVSLPGESSAEFRARLGEAMGRRAYDLFAHAERGLPTLAVIASVAPFVGLFGTVYGIMTSFAGIAEAKDTSLAVVAPGIAEALGATAWGLAAAIPAAVGYNRIGSALARLSQSLSHAIDERAVELALELRSPAARDAA